jgi:predicted DNA-binding transcriptional regulator YafY
MPKSAHLSALGRQWEMLRMIPKRAPGITAGQLREGLDSAGFPVNKRTVERDLNSLSNIFGLTCETDPGSRAQRWYFACGRSPEFGSVELVDAVSLALAGEVLDKVLPGALMDAVRSKIARAREKVKALDGVPLARWSEKVRYVPGTLEFQPPTVQPRILEAVHHALFAERQVEVKYDAFGQKTKTLLLNPLSLILRGSVPYLVATAYTYEDPRLYALHRMREVKVTSDPVVVPPEYSTEDYLRSGAMNFSDGGTFLLKARLSVKLAQYLTETPLSADQRIDCLDYKQGLYHLSATVIESWQLHFWLMSQGAEIVVEEPQGLRAQIENAHREALEAYATTDPKHDLETPQHDTEHKTPPETL